MPKRLSDPADIELLVLDVDGVLTDGRLYYGSKGEELKVFDVKDGYGIRRLLDAGVEVAIISGRDSRAVKRRAKDLGIRHVFQGIKDKLPVFDRLRRRLKLEAAACACVGDDRPDVPVMRAVGLSFAVADAHSAALEAADMITPRSGGRGAVRDICDLLLASREKRDARGSGKSPDGRGARSARSAGVRA